MADGEKKNLNMSGSQPTAAAWVPPPNPYGQAPPNRGPELTMSQLEEEMKKMGVGGQPTSSPNNLSAMHNSTPPPANQPQPGFYPGHYPQGWNIQGQAPGGVGGFPPMAHPQMGGAAYPYPAPGYPGYPAQVPPYQGWPAYPQGQMYGPPPQGPGYPGYFPPGMPPMQPYGHLQQPFSPPGGLMPAPSPSSGQKGRRKLKPVVVDKSDVDSDFEEIPPLVKEKKDKDKSSKKKKEKRDSSGEEKKEGKKDKKKKDKKKEKKTSMTRKPIAIIQKPTELPQTFGRPNKLERSAPKYKLIEKYVKNGSQAESSKVDVRVHQILEFGGADPPPPGGFTTPGRSSQPGKILLWWKTSPGSVRRLAQQKDGCIAFYDMITRAYAVTPKDLGKPLRQTMLLCSVSLGKMHNSPHGYKAWSTKGVPQGSDSVKGVGRFTPERKEDQNDNATIIPCGVATQHTQYQSYELDYNEYMIWEARRAKVKYAVDVELIPQGGGSSESEDDSE